MPGQDTADVVQLIRIASNQQDKKTQGYFLALSIFLVIFTIIVVAITTYVNDMLIQDKIDKQIAAHPIIAKLGKNSQNLDKTGHPLIEKIAQKDNRPILDGVATRNTTSSQPLLPRQS